MKSKSKLILKNSFLSFSRIMMVLKKNQIPWSVEIDKSVRIRDCNVGEHCYIGPNCIINCTDIGNYSSIAPGVQIGGMEHSHWWLSTNTNLSDCCKRGERTIIGHDVWIAANAIIKQGVKIGDGAVVGAGAFVNKDVPSYAIVVGTPAKVMKYRLDATTIQKLNKSKYWEESPNVAKAILMEIEKQL